MPVRVISGSAGGLFLKSPAGGFVRPTMDRVKSAIFSRIADRLEAARVLDLFAGTGSLGIEALSRGAAEATFVESDRRAVAVIEANLDYAGFFTPQGRVILSDATRFIRRTAERGGQYEIIFADPPYAQNPGDFDPGLDLARDPALRQILAPGGLFILERRTGDTLPEIAGLASDAPRRYGKTEVYFLTHAAA